MSKRWGEIALQNNMSNPDRPAEPLDDVTRVTPPAAAAWLAEHPAPLPASQAMRLVLSVPPSANRYWRYYRGKTVVSAEAQAYKDEVRTIAAIHGVTPFAGAVKVILHVYRNAKRGDLDNYAKILIDALSGAAYADDAQIVELHMYRHDDKNYPRVEIEIRQIGPHEFDTFESEMPLDPQPQSTAETCVVVEQHATDDEQAKLSRTLQKCLRYMQKCPSAKWTQKSLGVRLATLLSLERMGYLDAQKYHGRPTLWVLTDAGKQVTA